MWLPPINGVKQIPDAPRSESQILNSWYLNLPFDIFFYIVPFLLEVQKKLFQKGIIISVYKPIQNLDRAKPKCELYIIICLEILFSNWYIELLRMFSYLSFMKIAGTGKIMKYKVFFLKIYLFLYFELAYWKFDIVFQC